MSHDLKPITTLKIRSCARAQYWGCGLHLSKHSAVQAVLLTNHLALGWAL